VVNELRAPLPGRPGRRHRAPLHLPQRLRPRPHRRREPRQCGRGLRRDDVLPAGLPAADGRDAEQQKGHVDCRDRSDHEGTRPRRPAERESLQQRVRGPDLLVARPGKRYFISIFTGWGSGPRRERWTGTAQPGSGSRGRLRPSTASSTSASGAACRTGSEAGSRRRSRCASRAPAGRCCEIRAACRW
jgi:hypothetical protein